MKYSEKVTLEIKMKDFYAMAVPRVDKKQLHKAIKMELYQSLCGIINGDWGGIATDWKELFYFHLFKDGYIQQTQKSINQYGIFNHSKQ